MNRLKNTKHELYFVKEFDKDKLNICDLTWEKIFEYFFFNERILLSLVDNNDNLEGILTLGDFIKYGQNIGKAVNKNYHFVRYGNLNEMYESALRIYNEYEIQSDIPVVDISGRIVGYIADRKIISDKKNLAQKELNNFLVWIERIKKSSYLSKEIAAFQEILKGADICVYPCGAYSQVISALDIDLEVFFLSEQGYVKLIKDLSERKDHLTDKDKLRLIFDFDTGNRWYLRRVLGVNFIYDLDGFITEFTKLVENEEFSRILRITQNSAYKLKDYIVDNEIENIGFGANRLLTNYIYKYMEKNHIPVSFKSGFPFSSIRGSDKVNGVRRTAAIIQAFFQCDLIGQQFKFNQNFVDKDVSVFYIMCAVHAKMTDSERIRIKERVHLDTVIKNKDNETLVSLYGDSCKNLPVIEYVEAIYDRLPLPVRRRFENDIIVNCDSSSPYINIENGIRRTCNQPDMYYNTIYITGSCFALCQYVQDDNTIPSLLAKKLTEDGYAYRVINLGMLAAFNAAELVRLLSFRNGDIVIHLFGGPVTEKEENIIDTSSAFDAISDREEMFVDWPSHCSKKGNAVYANIIYQKIKNTLKNNTGISKERNNIYNIFKTNTKDLYLYDFEEYCTMLRKVRKEIPQKVIKIGTVAMNCNPFTIGHQHLVEYALQQCDYLIIFIMEENKSYFDFKDRFAIAKGNCKKYANVTLIPSGKFFGSTATVPEYFMREKVRDQKNVQNEFKINPILDHRVFASYIASELGIKKRFVAEEPLDSMTRQYNQEMKKVLPMFGIEVEEIPRKTLPSGEIISASTVRQMYRNSKFEQMREMLPEYTYNYLVKVSSQYLKKKKTGYKEKEIVCSQTNIQSIFQGRR